MILQCITIMSQAAVNEEKISTVRCEGYHHVKRHKIGIFPEDRAVMAFNGRYYSVGFENLKSLMHYGTDVIVVEKAGTVLKDGAIHKTPRYSVYPITRL